MNKKLLNLPFDAQRSIEALGANLKIARKRRKWRQSDLQDRAGISPSTVQRIERGDPSVSIYSYLMLLDVYGCVGGVSEIITPENDLLAPDFEYGQRIRKRKILDNDF